jgi:intraflagellar transport protein 88
LIADIIQEKNKSQAQIIEIAKLIAPIIEGTVLEGYQWVIDTLRTSLYPETISELEIARAIYYVKTRNIDLAIESLKNFEKRDENMMA